MKKNSFNVVGELHHQFEPIEATLYLLAESHLSIHTFVNERDVTIDTYHCAYNVDFDKVLNFFLR